MFECHINVVSWPCFRLFQHLTAILPVGPSAPHVWCTSSSEKPLITGDMNHQLKSSTEWCLHDHIHPISSMYMYSIMVRDLSWSPRFQDSPDDILILAASIAHPRSSPNKHQQTLPISGDTHTISGSSQGTGWYVAILPDRRAWERLWRTTPGNTRCGHSKWIDPVTVVSKGIVNLTYWTMGLVFPKVLLTLLVMLWFILCERCK